MAASGIVFGEQCNFDLHRGVDHRMFDLFGERDDSAHCQFNDDGLRVVLNAKRPGVVSAGAAAKFVLRGDFHVTAAFRAAEISVPGGGCGAGPTLALVDSAGQVASLQCVVQSDGVRRFVAHWGLRDGGASLRHEAKMWPTSATQGVLRMSRRGAEIRYEVSVGDRQRYDQLHQTSFSTADIVQIHLAAQSGEWWPCVVDITWKNIEIEADQLLPSDEWESATGRPPRGRRVACGVLIVLLVWAVGDGLRRRLAGAVNSGSGRLQRRRPGRFTV